MARWVKGQSGNPGGRPRIQTDLRELARANTREAVETLAAIMQDKTAAPAARVSAATALLDRGYGRPAQTVYQQHANVSLDELSDAELTAIARGDADADADASAGRTIPTAFTRPRSRALRVPRKSPNLILSLDGLGVGSTPRALPPAPI
jgi:Family of unknown function (DUF5681)